MNKFEKNEGCFPRTSQLPSQSPLFWVSQKDRYLRQLLIADIEAVTNRRLVVYFTSPHQSAMIDHDDVRCLYELLSDCSNEPVDLFIETPGGVTDAAEQLIQLIEQLAPGFRALIPHRAKSNGTLLALAASEILMGVTSELGPCDPMLAGVPVEFILNAADSLNPLDVQHAIHAQKQTKTTLSRLLKQHLSKNSNMSAEQKNLKLDELVTAFSTREVFASHGTPVGPAYLTENYIAVEHLSKENELWQKLWLLFCMYTHDCQMNGYSKIFETRKISISKAPDKSCE
ncbi:MAG: hypothetical protein VKJ06_07030 [Vampirovibrionales bacterium]|nr:hypothetical protein [Vampirovibrionales bacterium]